MNLKQAIIISFCLIVLGNVLGNKHGARPHVTIVVETLEKEGEYLLVNNIPIHRKNVNDKILDTGDILRIGYGTDGAYVADALVQKPQEKE